MTEFFLPQHGVSMNDILTTTGAAFAALVAWRQKEKDKQIANRDEDIKALKQEIERLKSDLDHCYDKRAELADKKLN